MPSVATSKRRLQIGWRVQVCCPVLSLIVCLLSPPGPIRLAFHTAWHISPAAFAPLSSVALSISACASHSLNRKKTYMTFRRSSHMFYAIFCRLNPTHSVFVLYWILLLLYMKNSNHHRRDPQINFIMVQLQDNNRYANRQNTRFWKFMMLSIKIVNII